MFTLDEPKFGSNSFPDGRRLYLETALGETNSPRIADIISFEFELWFRATRRSSERQFLARLVPDWHSDWKWHFERHGQKYPLRLAWDYTLDQFQVIEDARGDEIPMLEVNGRVGVMSQWQDSQRQGTAAKFAWEDLMTVGGQGLILVPMTLDTWVGLLKQVGYRHCALQVIPSKLSSDFAVAEQYLHRAWKEQWKREPDTVMAECYKALECLGQTLFAEELDHQALLKRLMPGAHPTLIELVGNHAKAVRDLLNRGRHAKDGGFKLDKCDSELALLATNSLLLFLSKSRSRIQ